MFRKNRYQEQIMARFLNKSILRKHIQRFVISLHSKNPVNTPPAAEETLETTSAGQLKLLDRSDYKSTWERLSATRNDAMLHIAGSTDEAKFAKTAQHTVELLEQFVGINSSDVVLEIGCGIGRVGKVLSERSAVLNMAKKV